MQTLLPFDPPEDRSALYFVTNRSNLVEILSSGLLTGRSGFQKYYPDYLQYAPDRVPLFAGPLDESIVEAIDEQGPEDSFPVILEVDPSLLSQGKIDALSNGGEEISVEPGNPSGSVWAAPAVIPRQAIRSVMFMTEEAHQDFVSRPYENARTDAPPFRSGDEVCGPGQVTYEEVAEWLNNLPELDALGDGSIRREDRVSGGVLTAIVAAEEEGHYSQPLLDLMRGEFFEVEREGPSALPVWFRQPLRPEDRRHISNLPKDHDSCLFRAVVDELLDVDLSERWNNEEVLNAIKNRFAETEVDEEGRDYILKQFDYLSDVIRARRRFDGFNEGGSDVIKSLLLVLVRPEPSRLLSWSREDTGANTPIMVTAGLFSGIILGRKRMPADLRPSEIDDRLAWLAADRLREEYGVYGPSDSVPATRPVDPIDVLLRADLEEEEPRQVALEICRKAGWDDCVSTILIPPGDETMEMFYTRSRKDGRRKVAAFRIRGEAEVEYEISAEAFERRLREDGRGLDDEILEEARSDLAAKGIA